MSLLNNTSDLSTSSALARSLRLVRRRTFRAANNAIAAVIAQREHQAQMTILRRMSDRELRDIGLSRGNVGAGLAQAARERMRAQRLLTARL